MELKNVDDLIKKFRSYVIQQARSNLTKGGKNVSSKLYNSLQSEVLKEDNYSLINFSMEDYGAYQDLGVKGKSSSSKAPNSPFKFGSGKGRKGGLTEGIDKWVRNRGIQFRDKETGKFLSYQSTAFIITRSIYQTGIRPSLFFTKPFEVAKDRYLGKELIKAFKADIETLISYKLENRK
jgi:hypothetical protein